MSKEHYVLPGRPGCFQIRRKGMADVSCELMQRNNLTADDITWLWIPHQANLRIIDATANRMDLPRKGHDQYPEIRQYDSRHFAPLPVGIGKKLHKGDNIILRLRLWRWFPPEEPPG